MQGSRTVDPLKAHIAHVQAPETQQTKRRRSRAPRRVVIGLVVMHVLMLTLPVVYSLAQNGRVLKGVHVLDMDLSGMNRAEAQ